MKVKELIDFLKKQNPDATILLSSDEEGNSYSPVDLDCGYATGNFEKEKGTFADPRNFVYTMDEDEMHGDYIILYPR